MLFEYSYNNIYYAHRRDEPPEEGTPYERRYYNIHELVYLVRGEAELVVGSKRYRLVEGNLFLVQPRRHFYLRHVSREGYECYVVRFTEYMVPRDLIPVLSRLDGVYTARDTPLPPLFARFDSHIEAIGGDRDTLRMLFRCVLTEILVYLCRMCPKPASGTTVLKEDITSILDYIDRNIESPLQLEDICREFHYSKSYLCREFSRCMGMPIMQYIRGKKMSYADALLVSGMRPTLVARQCGFVNYSTFYRMYRKLRGGPPSGGA